MTDIIIPAIADDGSLFPIEKLEAHQKGQFHLAISVFVFSPDGKLLLQRRADGKYHCGGLWANTCCSHPHWEEDIAACAHRRLQEELGFSLPLRPIGQVDYKADVGNGLIEHERVHMFAGDADPASLSIQVDPDEVAEVRWVDLATLRQELTDKPEEFTPWFTLYVERWSDLWAPAA